MGSYCVRRFLHLNNFRRQDVISKAPAVITKATKLTEKSETLHFVDWIQVRVKAGDGGDGGVTLLSRYAKEFAGPDGGNGGSGGHVIFRACKSKNSLNELKVEVSAEDGGQGRKNHIEGKNGKHRIIDVPVGTIFRNMERQVVAEVDKDGAMFLAARGGTGGKGNAHFKTSERQTPLSGELGGKGEYFNFDVELQTMAEIGLIGKCLFFGFF